MTIFNGKQEGRKLENETLYAKIKFQDMDEGDRIREFALKSNYGSMVNSLYGESNCQSDQF